MDLQCIIESHKTLDKQALYKTGDICQVRRVCVCVRVCACSLHFLFICEMFYFHYILCIIQYSSAVYKDHGG